LLLGDEIRYRLKRPKLLTACTGLLGLGRLSHEPACAQIGEGVSFAHRRKPCDSPAPHRHDYLTTLSDMVYVPTQLIVQLTDTYLVLRH
jgi:hypothetical protein